MNFVRERIDPVQQRFQAEYDELVAAAAREGGLDAADLARQAAELRVVPLAARDWLAGKTADFRRRLAAGEDLTDLLPEAFVAVRYASWIARNHRQFDVQLVAGQVLAEGAIAEEATGEGKTIACYPAVYARALEGKKVHVVTVNDYLVVRDAEFAAPVFQLLDMRVGYITSFMPSYGAEAARRHTAYACDVTYGINSEFGFDYLRDNMKLSVADQFDARRDFAIVDEVDSILIDEARTPLIISGPAYGDVNRYRTADAVTRELIKRHRAWDQANRRVDGLKRSVKSLTGELDKAESAKKASVRKKLDAAREELARAEEELEGHVQYYEVELDKKSAHLTHEGVTAAQDVAGIGSFYVGANMEWPHLLEQSLRAHVVYEKDKEYVVRDGEVVIVDEFTGRLMEGRQWSDGLHQAVEAKERVTVKEENQTLATVTIQNFFKLYDELAGMTGTAMTEAEEFMKIYELDVVNVPTHRPVNRMDYEDRVYATVEVKYDAIVEEIRRVSRDKRRPVLVGTTSIEKSDKLSAMLTHRYGIEHQVLNARPENAAREADIVARAGTLHPLKSGGKDMVGTVTIATNMAGRGTDIKLGPGVVWDNCKVPSDEKLAELGVEAQDLFPPGSTKCCIYCPEYDEATGCAHCYKPKIDADFPLRGRTGCRDDVPCGLHIVGTERHEARRIDNQLRGRSGRQGDPGSSRFFLSLRDDLMAIFAGEWTLKALGWLGLQEDEPIEHKRITSGIARAQKKVEQRNFDIRKNLLEYDEVMDRQRKHFYGRRQQILEGRDIEPTIRETVSQTIGDAVGNYLAGDYVRRCIAEWARQNLEVSVSPAQIGAASIEDLPQLEQQLRDRAREEAQATISMTIGEYTDPDLDPKDWDLRGLSSWAMSRFGVGVSQNQLRSMTPSEMERAIAAAADERIDQADLSPLQRFLADGYPARALAEWARSKFGFVVDPSELSTEDPSAAEARLHQAAEDAYLRREFEYPAEYAIDVTLGQSGPDNVYAQKALCDWANRKFEAGWEPRSIADKSPAEIRGELVAMAEQFLVGGRLEKTVDEFLAGSPDDSAAIAWAQQRFDVKLSAEQLADGEATADRREKLIAAGRAFLRRELTELERFVLLQIHDSTWKDHLLAMDHLRSGVGLRGFAEQDPKIAYKKEGFRLFEEMLASIRERVSDIIFKARLAGRAEVANVYQISQAVHEQLSGYDHLAQDMAAQQAAGAVTKVEQIIRQTPKVGRNDPCPCGSGKKYKKCHGRNAT